MDEIRKITSRKSSDHSPKISQGSELRDIALLYRTNAQSRSIEEGFIRAGIPYVLIGGTKFYERKEIKDLLSYLRVVLNPADMISYRRVEKLGKRKLAQVLELRVSKPSELLTNIIVASQYLDQFDEKVEEDLSRIENIKELQSVASEFEDLSEFLENVALVQAEYYEGEKLGKGDKRDAVTLMTLHAAKGLEFPIVFLIGMEEDCSPPRSLMEIEEMEERRRWLMWGSRGRSISCICRGRNRE